MKILSILPFAVVSKAFVIPDEQVFNLQHVEVENRLPPVTSVPERVPSTSDLLDELELAGERFWKVRTEAEALVHDTSDRLRDTYFDVQGWLQSQAPVFEDIKTFFDEHSPHHDEPDHDNPPHDGPGHDHPPHGDHPHHPPGHRRPGFVKSNLTVYQLISESNYTTKLAKLINEFDDLVEALNGTSANFTVFAPTDRAFEKIPEDAPKPSKEQLKALLSYHVSPEFYPAGRVLVTRTIPTLLKGDRLGDKPHPQRLSTNIGPRGLTVNFYSRIVAVDIFGSNGVIHGVDSIILPPPKAVTIIDLLPGEFSTLELGLGKTGLLEALNSTDHPGGTLFAPSNFAFQKLGPKINAFLFSKFGLKYLKALLEYHVVPKHVLYSDAYYKPESDDSDEVFKRDDKHRGPPKGFYHVDLPTLLEDRDLAINIFRYGRLIEIKINGFSRVVISDGVASDGVIHVVSDVLVPPKQLGSAEEEEEDDDAGREMSVEEFKERLEPFVRHNLFEWTDL